MIDPAHIWNAIYHARSNSTHPPTSPNTAPVAQNSTPKSKRNLPKTIEGSFGDAFCVEKYKISRSGYVPKFHQILRLPPKSDTPTSANVAPATKTDTATSLNAVPATKSETPTLPNMARVTKMTLMIDPAREMRCERFVMADLGDVTDVTWQLLLD